MAARQQTMWLWGGVAVAAAGGAWLWLRQQQAKAAAVDAAIADPAAAPDSAPAHYRADYMPLAATDEQIIGYGGGKLTLALNYNYKAGSHSVMLVTRQLAGTEQDIWTAVGLLHQAVTCHMKSELIPNAPDRMIPRWLKRITVTYKSPAGATAFVSKYVREGNGLWQLTYGLDLGDLNAAQPIGCQAPFVAA